MKTILRIIMCIALLLPLMGCEHRELCYDHSHMTDLEVVFDWSKIPDADPRTMVVHFFRPDGSYFRRMDFVSREGGKMRIEAGEYMVLFHNGETDVVREKGTDYSDYMLGSLTSSLLAPMGRTDSPPRPSDSADEPVAGVPEEIWTGVGGKVNVIRGKEGQVVRLVPMTATKEYTIEIDNVENLSEGLDISAALTGMSSQFSLSGQCQVGPHSTLPLDIERVDDHTLIARFRAFGHCPDEDRRHIFTVYTSEKTYHNFDVTQQMHEASDPDHIFIRLEGLKLPSIGTGMSPDVSGWDDITDIDIPMN